MAVPFSQYDPLGVILTFGPYVISGFMDGTFIEAQRDEAAFTKKVGATGGVARVKNRNRAGSIKFTLMVTSPSNAILSGIHSLGEAETLTTADVMPCMVKSLSDLTRLHATNAWIQKVANASYGKDLPAREWTLDCEAIDMDLGDGFGE